MAVQTASADAHYGANPLEANVGLRYAFGMENSLILALLLTAFVRGVIELNVWYRSYVSSLTPAQRAELREEDRTEGQAW